MPSEPRPRQPTTYEPRSVAQRLGQAKLQELVAAYESGTPTTTLMKEYSLSKSAVLKALADHGVLMRRQPITDDDTARAVALYASGQTVVAVANELGLARESVRRALLEAGVTMRPRGRKARG